MEFWHVGGLIVIILALMIIGAPVFISFLGGAVFYMAFSTGLSPITMAQTLLSSVNSWVLLALPFYILAGLIMAYGNTAKTLVDLMESLLGRIPGGMQMGAVGACTFFSAMCGSGTATTVAIGAVMVDPLTARGYDKKTTMGCIVTAGTLGNIIPPSIGFVLIASWEQLSVGKLFIAGIIPGLVIAAALAITAFIICRKQGRATGQVSWRTRGRYFVKATPALLTPVIILGGIYGGIFTATEAAAVAVVYAVLISFAIYRPFSLGKLREVLLDSMRTTGKIYIIFGASVLFSQILTYHGIPQAIVQFMLGANLGWIFFMMVCLIVLIILGMFFDGMAIWAICLPIMRPTAMALGINPIHFAVFLVACIVLGGATPPFGTHLFAMSALTGESIEDISRGAFPFICAEAVCIAIIALIPALSTWLPAYMK